LYDAWLFGNIYEIITHMIEKIYFLSLLNFCLVSIKSLWCTVVLEIWSPLCGFVHLLAMNQIAVAGCVSGCLCAGAWTEKAQHLLYFLLYCH